MAYFHKNLTQKKWNSLSKDKQILNICSELIRAKNWLLKNKNDYMKNSLDRALELIDLTSADRKWRRGSLKELLRLREALSEFYIENSNDVSYFVKLIRVLLRFNRISSAVKV
jgi:hypothetical protein